MNKRRLIFSIIAILLGPVAIFLGGMDDSPGLQLIGLMMLIGGIVGAIKSRKKQS